MTGTEDRARIVAFLRTVADLLESSEDVPAPKVDVTFWVRDASDNTATAAVIARALPGPWAGEQQHYGDSDFLDLGSRQNFGAHAGISASIVVPIADAATEAGTKTVTVWETRPEIAALLAEQPEGSEGQ